MKTDVLRQMADIHKALSNYIRLAIMRILSAEDRTVNQVVNHIREEYGVKGMDRTNISKHLGLLKGMGIISCVSRGQQRVYHLEARCLMSAMECTLGVVKRK